MLGPEFRMARALGDPTRFRIHRLVEGAERPVAVAELATELGLHPNAIRQHLAVLRDAGLVDEQSERRGRGRPRLVYTPARPRDSTTDAYRHLAALLAEVTASGRPAREIGWIHGLRTAESQHRAWADPTEASGDAIAAAVAEAARLGFDPIVVERAGEAGRAGMVEIHLRNCPFAAAVAVDPGTVCDLHHGLVEGIVAAGGGAHVEALVPGAEVCRVVISRVPGPEAVPPPTGRDNPRGGRSPGPSTA